MFKYFGFNSDFIDEENIISKLNLLFRLEKMDPYSCDNTLQERMRNSLECIPAQHRQYALALFANTIYFPSIFSTSVLQHMLNSLVFKYNIDWGNLGKRCLILENDPTGIINQFLRVNNVHGRLDKKTFQRTQQIKPFTALAKMERYYPQINSDDRLSDLEKVLPFIDKDYWIVLVDNSLSGTSLLSDLKRLFEIRDEASNKPKKIILLIRTLTKKAKDCIEEAFKDQISSEILKIEYGLYLDDRFVINSSNKKNCSLFHSEATYEGVVEVCKWLSESVQFRNDGLLDRCKTDSTGAPDLTFGYKDCGITFVSSENCPSDSLPLLWYQNDSFYTPPFPRVLSRIED